MSNLSQKVTIQNISQNLSNRSSFQGVCTIVLETKSWTKKQKSFIKKVRQKNALMTLK
jgi:hypothetical protein